eukprot:scaffold12816_cov64-Phaeocystis_antarctica.AAC.4
MERWKGAEVQRCRGAEAQWCGGCRGGAAPAMAVDRGRRAQAGRRASSACSRRCLGTWPCGSHMRCRTSSQPERSPIAPGTKLKASEGREAAHVLPARGGVCVTARRAACIVSCDALCTS